MYSVFSPQSLVFAFSLFRLISADCRSTGTDYLDGGGPYCVNTTSTDYFSFGTSFNGCVPSDTQGDVIPILIDPNTDEFFCSGISTQPDGVEMISTCNVQDNEVRKSDMTSGKWIVVIEGLTFAWMRSFLVNAGPPVTFTSTPTATFSVTSTPIATATTTNVITAITTLPAKTVTLPSTTRTITSTITPRAVTTTITSLVTFTMYRPAFATTVKTVTITTPCTATKGSWDPVCTIKPTKAHFFAAHMGIRIARSGRLQRDRAWAQEMRQEAERRGLLEARTVDQCTTTVLATTNLPSTTLTITAATSTVVITTDVTTTSTQTPPPITSLSGQASTTVTITKPTPTSTRIIRGFTNTIVTNTIWATLTSTIQVKPTGTMCMKH